MRLARRIGKWLALTIFGVTALFALIFAVLQTSPGKTLLASLASSLASSEDLKIEIAGIEGFLPSDISIRSVQLSDARGPFAAIDGLHAKWRPFALMRGVIDVENAGAARVELLRKPEASSSNSATQPSGGGGLSVPAIRIGRFSLDRIEIAEPVIGSAATLSLIASADLSAMHRGMSGSFELERFDAPGRIAGKIDYAPDSDALAIDIAANEPAGGLISRTLALDGLPPITATVKGEGPLGAFDARVNAAAGDVARVGGSVTVRSAPRGHKIEFAFETDAAKLLPTDLQPLFADVSRLAGKATVDEAMRIDIGALSAQTAGFTAQAKGAFDASAMTADLAYKLDLGPSATFSELAQGADWSSVGLEGAVKGALAAPAISAQARARAVSGAGYSARSIVLNVNTTPDARKNLTLALRGEAEGLSARDAKVAAALGDRAEFAVTGAKDFAGPVFINAMTARLHALAARFEGRASAQQVAGKLKIDNFELAALSPLAGRSLSGSAALEADVDASGDLSRAQVRISASAKNIATGIDAVDEIFGKSANVSGLIARNEKDALRLDQLRLSGNGLTLAANGAITRDKANLEALLSLDNLARLDRRLSGAASAEAAFSGGLDDLGLKLRLSVPAGAAMRQPVESLTMAIDARDITGRPSANMALAGRIAGKPASGAAAFTTKPDGTRRIDGLALSVGSVNAKGDLALDANSLATGRVSLVAGNLADLSALALTELAGRLNADISLGADGGRQRVTVKADADNVRAAGHALDRARVDLAVTDPAGAPMVSGNVQIAGVKAGGVEIPKAVLNAEPKDGGAALQLNAVANSVAVTLAGHLSQRNRDAAFRLDKLNLSRGGAQVTTTRPANITLSGGAVAIDRLELSTKGGGATIAGKAGDTLDLQIDLRALPLSLAELAASGLGLAGTISGSANISGSPSAPAGAYKLSLARISTPDLAKNGVGPLDINAEGQLRGGRVDTRTRISGRHLSDLVITGSAPIAAGDLDLAIKGAVDLAIANAALATSGARVSGRATIDATLKGPPGQPRAGGSVRIGDGRFEDSVNGVTLNKIEGLITGTNQSVTLNSLTASTTNNGRISAQGAVSLDAGAGFPGKIDIDLVNAGLVSSELMRMVGEGRVSIEGALANAPRLTGRIVVKSLDVNIPDRLPGGGAALDVRHVNAGGKTSASTKRTPPPQRKASANAGMPLDITVSAPNNVFVRGMGLTAELGGDIKITGSSSAPITNGGFEMRRGDFEIIGKRLNFTRGKVSFSGSTDPDLDFVAETRASDITAQILVTGPASKPSITFGSTPSLPQDEVLARLMFGRASGSLTPGQALQIAQTIAQFSGGGPGVLEKMRRSLGVDSLNVGTDATGKGGQVGIGKRLNDRIYLGVRQGTTPNSSQVTIDVDITRNLRLQGATGADGSAEVGIGAQWDY